MDLIFVVGHLHSSRYIKAVTAQQFCTYLPLPVFRTKACMYIDVDIPIILLNPDSCKVALSLGYPVRKPNVSLFMH